MKQLQRCPYGTSCNSHTAHTEELIEMSLTYANSHITGES